MSWAISASPAMVTGGVYRALMRSRVRGRPLKEHLWREGVRLLVLHNIDNAAARPF
jgi:hypothetical protein